MANLLTFVRFHHHLRAFTRVKVARWQRTARGRFTLQFFTRDALGRTTGVHLFRFAPSPSCGVRWTKASALTTGVLNGFPLSRQPAGILAEQGGQRILKVPGGDAFQVE